jgi:hypothetical protein
MRAATRFLGALGVLLLCGAGAASAQHPQHREGFWIGFGFGYGSANGTCTGCSSASEGGVTGFLKLGGTLSPKVLLGGAVNAFSKASNGATETLGNVTASVFYYPAPASGFFLTGGLGFSDYDLSGGGSSITGAGWGFTAGLGYDIPVGRKVSLTPVVDFLYGSVGDLSSGGTTFATGWKQTVVDFGLGVTFHH